MKRFCKPLCNETRYVPHYSFYNLEANGSGRAIKNRFTIFFDSTDYLNMIEDNMKKPKKFFADLGGVWTVYTGMSIIAGFHAVVLLICAGYDSNFTGLKLS